MDKPLIKRKRSDTEDLNESIHINKKRKKENELTFNEIEHKYFYNDKEFISVTTFIGNVLFEPFDEIKISEIIALKTDLPKTDKYFGKNALEIREIWENDRNLGINMHKTIENYLNGDSLSDDELNSKEFKMFKQFENDHINTSLPLISEFRIFDKDLEMAGTIDMIYKLNEKNVILYDWKRINDLKKSNVYQSGIVDATKNCPDDDYTKYSIQLWLYKYILEKNYSVIVDKMYLLLLHPTQNTYIREEIKTYQPLLDSIIKERMLNKSIFIYI
jgi:hypothetical protein